jgi:hypothetical protein
VRALWPSASVRARARPRRGGPDRVARSRVRGGPAVTAGTRVAPGSPPCSAASAGAREEQEGHAADTGLPAGRRRAGRRGCRTRSACRLQRHAPEDLLDVVLRQRVLDLVVGADGDAAGEDEHVDAGQRLLDRATGGLGRVGGDRVLADLGTRGDRQRGEQSPRWSCGSGRVRAARRAVQLVARRQDGDARPAGAAHRGAAGHHGDAERRRRQARARGMTAAPARTSSPGWRTCSPALVAPA